MKRLFIYILLLISISAGATTYYVDPGGNDSNSGSIGSPWKTLYKAVNTVTTFGDVIHLNAGTYNENTQMFVSPGVSIEGADKNTVTVRSGVTSTYAFLIMFDSYPNLVNGNQHVTGITFDGIGATAYGCIAVQDRSNVTVYDCIFKDFYATGPQWKAGTESTSTPPNHRATGNAFYNNTLTNCSYASGGYGSGGLRWGGQDGFQCHDNVMSQTGRSSGTNGYVVKYAGEGWNINSKIYNNTVTKSYDDGTTFDFAFEFGREKDLEVYNNTITGAFDVNFISKNTNIGLYFHDNIIGPSSPVSSRIAHGLILEFDVADIIVTRNIFRNCGRVILFSTRSNYDLSNNLICYNIAYGIGQTGTTAGRGIQFLNDDGANQVASNGFYVYNNVWVGQTGTQSAWGISVPSGDDIRNTYVQNNIIMNFSSGAIAANPASAVNGLWITNNDLYNNGAQYVEVNGTGTNVTLSNNITSNPNFVSSTDFHLQAGSPCINSGYHIASLTTDFAGATVGNPPEIGAYEYGTSITLPSVTTLPMVSIWGGYATGSGVVTSDGGATVTFAGLLYSTSPNPRLSSNMGGFTIPNPGLDVFDGLMGFFTPGTLYYVCAYATNSVGTAYGADVSFVAANPLLLHKNGKEYRKNGKVIVRR